WFTWYDLMTTDVDGARDFYTKVLGWGIEMYEGADPDRPYPMWVAEAPMGGVMELPEEAAAAGAPPHWLAYIGADDVGAAAARAEELGGRIEHRQQIPDVGEFAVVSDPQGAVFAIYEPSGEPPEGTAWPPGTGQVSWHELATTDYEAAFDFYAELFGWEVNDEMDMGDGWMYRMFGKSGMAPFGGIFNKPPDVPVPGWLYYVRVADLDAALDRVRQHGGAVVNGPQ
ncbi:MAG: VOC family protein, partial [Gammaproteobacteria bacterium]|nr:VOC family protein [Gemmatimonadota bacterium]NIU79695.1 VOC family protein [Gammaproteobacteria bacterium]